MKTLLILLALLISPTLSAKSVFYQPNVSDKVLPITEWQSIFKKMKSSGFDSLIVQWCEYGPTDFGISDGWLLEVVSSAREHGIKVHMGLYSDPLFFERARGTDQEIASYLNAYLIKNLTLLEEILNSTASQSIDSWYLPAEFDDRYWTSETRTRLLAEQLAKWNSAVSARTQKPWSSSSFFTGWKSPDGYANWLRQIPYKFWIQDGSGTRKLTEEQRLLYLDRIDKNRSRLILEAFEQLSSDANFTAKPRAYKDLQGLERKYESRGFKEVAYFSLRYMPFADGKLKLPSN